MYHGAKRRAKLNGLEFNLTGEDIIIPERCPVLDIKLQHNKTLSDTSPSLDRIDTNKGYVKGNVMIISFRANRIKNDASLEELEKILKYVKNETIQ